MSETLRRVQTLVLAGDYLISDHGYDELAKDDILPGDALAGIAEAIAIGGPSVLALQRDADSRPIHVLWGVPAGRRSPAVLVTAYRPDPELWEDDFKKRKVP